jgi:hypothetical protein
LATNREISIGKQKAANARLKFPFDSKAILEADLDVERLTDGMDRLLKLEAELFS